MTHNHFLNEIGAVVANGINTSLAQQHLAEFFLAFLISDRGQKAIATFNE